MRWSSLVVISCGVGCTLFYETLFCHQGLMTYLKPFSTDDQTSLYCLTQICGHGENRTLMSARKHLKSEGES